VIFLCTARVLLGPPTPSSLIWSTEKFRAKGMSMNCFLFCSFTLLFFPWVPPHCILHRLSSCVHFIGHLNTFQHLNCFLPDLFLVSAVPHILFTFSWLTFSFFPFFSFRLPNFYFPIIPICTYFSYRSKYLLPVTLFCYFIFIYLFTVSLKTKFIPWNDSCITKLPVQLPTLRSCHLFTFLL